MKRWSASAITARVVWVTAIALVLPANTGNAAAEEAAAPVAVLGDTSPWRCFSAYGYSEVRTTNGTIERVMMHGSRPGIVPEGRSPLPPADWVDVAFNDLSWERPRVPTRGLTYDTALLALRTTFEVNDPGQVKALTLSMTYYGGAIVYVNGKEVVRAHLAAGKPDFEALAEDYPLETFLRPDGNPLKTYDGTPYGALSPDVREECGRRLALRLRRLNEVEIPPALLRRGTNVLAVEVHRAPVAGKMADLRRKGQLHPYWIWPPIGLRSLALTAPSGSAVTPNTARAPGIHVWNAVAHYTATAFDYGDPNLPLKPVEVAAARNGVFSGRLIVDSAQPIRNLKVAVSDLAKAGGDGKISATAIRLRCAEPATPERSWVPPHRYDGLPDTIPAEIPVVKAPHWPKPDGHLELGVPEDKNLSDGAVAPLWITVRVPRETTPGAYKGMVTVSADGLAPVSVPLHVSVCGWTVPDSKDWRIHNFAYHSEDAVALHYDVPRWSSRHFALMGKSMALMAEINSRQAIVNLAINFYGGNKGSVDCSNAETLVRWIRQPDGSFKYDFTNFDKYLDLAAKTMGKPTLLRVNCWNEAAKRDGKLEPGESNTKGARNLSVSVFDPSTGAVTPLEQPTPGTPGSLAFWKPVLEELRKRVEARGWWDVTAMGWNSYCYPPIPEIVGMYRKIWPDGVWSYTAHNGRLGMRFPTEEEGVSMPVRHADCLWTLGTPTPRGCRALLEERPNYWCFTWRSAMRDHSAIDLLRCVAEDEIARGHDGVSDFGADLFPLKGEKGRFYLIGNGRGTGGPGCSTQAMLAPGSEGAISTERFEMLREGMQLAEAVLFLQRAIEEKRIGGDLLERVNRCLDERGIAVVEGRVCPLARWSGYLFHQDAKLLALAGEVATVVTGPDRAVSRGTGAK